MIPLLLLIQAIALWVIPIATSDWMHTLIMWLPSIF